MRESSRAPAYACIYHGLATIARRHGYALSIHGTMAHDLDLVAIPWTDDAEDAATVMEAIKNHISACGMYVQNDGSEIKLPTRKPHGRMAWRLVMEAAGSVDLSVMPRIGVWKMKMCRACGLKKDACHYYAYENGKLYLDCKVCFCAKRRQRRKDNNKKHGRRE